MTAKKKRHEVQMMTQSKIIDGVTIPLSADTDNVWFYIQ